VAVRVCAAWRGFQSRKLPPPVLRLRSVSGSRGLSSRAGFIGSRCHSG